MKIFLSFLQSQTKHPIPAYSFWEFYIKNGIEENGDEWIEMPGADWAIGLVPRDLAAFSSWKSEIWENTVAFLKKHRVDLFLSYLYPEQVDEGAVRQIKSLGIPCVNFFCDNVRQFRTIPKEFAVFDLNWVPEYKAITMYKRAGYPTVNLPMPMWVAPRDRGITREESENISFIGSSDFQRATLFSQALNLDPHLNLDIYGSGWREENKVFRNPADRNGLMSRIKFQGKFLQEYGIKAAFRKLAQRKMEFGVSNKLKEHLKGVVDFDDYIRITKESMITVGINRYPSFSHPLNAPDSYSRLRDIEAPMLGACYLTEWTEGLDQYYSIGSEIEVYHSAEDMVEKVKILSGSSSRRKSLRIKGQFRALESNSITQSLKKISCLIKQ